ncbi:hypothetical protein Gotur_032445, partial [Gossypium turneri]
GSEKLLLREVFTSVQESGSLSGYIRTYVFVRFSSPCSHREMYSPEPNWFLDRKLIMENEFLDKVENNAGDFTCINITQNNLQEFREIWAQWDDKVRQLFYHNYGDLPYLLDIKVDEHLFRALAQFWNSAYSCFTFGEVDMVPTVEEYTALLRCPRIQVDKVYSRTANVLTFIKKLAKITRMSEQWVTARIK